MLRSKECSANDALTVLAFIYWGEKGTCLSMNSSEFLEWSGIKKRFYYLSEDGKSRSVHCYAFGKYNHYKTGVGPYKPTHNEFADWLDKYWWAL